MAQKISKIRQELNRSAEDKMKRAFKNVHSTGIASVKGQGSRKEFENTYSQFCTAYENYKKERAKPKAEGE